MFLLTAVLPQAPAPQKNVILSVANCAEGAQQFLLLLTLDEMDPPKQRTRPYRITHYKLRKVTFAENRIINSDVLWQDSSYYMASDPRRSHVSFDLKSNQHVILLTVASFDEDRLNITVYKIDPSKTTSASLAEFDENGFFQLPPESKREKPLATFDKQLPTGASCNVGQVVTFGTILQSQSLLIAAEREACPGIMFRLDLKTLAFEQLP